MNIAHQPEDIHESKVKDNIGTVRATREQFKQAGTNNSIPGFLFVHLGTKSFVPPVKVTDVRTIADVLNTFRGMLSKIDKLLKIYFTFPATSVTSERSFSSLRTYLRSTMSDCRLNNLFLLLLYSPI